MLLLWCISGGFLLHFYESSLLDIILKQNYEKAVNTAEELLERGLSVISTPGAESRIEILKNSPTYVTRTLAERTVIPKVITL